MPVATNYINFKENSMKRILCILITFIIMFTLPTLINADEVKSTGTEIQLSLTDAYAMLEKNNLDIRLMDKKVVLTNKKYENSLKLAKDAAKKDSYFESTNLQYRKEEKLNWQVDKLELEDLNNQRIELVRNLKYDIKQQFINISLTNNDINLLNEEIKNVDKKLAEIQTRIKLGQVKETEYKQIVAQKITLSNQLSALKKQVELAQINLKKMLGINISSKIKLIEFVLPNVALNVADVEKDIEKAASSSFELYKLKKQLEYKQLEKQLTVDNSTNKTSLAISNLDTAILELENKIDQQVIDSMVQYWNDYYNILTLKDNIAIEELNLEIEKLNYNSVQTKSKLGMVDVATESNAQVAYNRQKNNLQRAMYNYIMVVEQFNEKLAIQQQ